MSNNKSETSSLNENIKEPEKKEKRKEEDPFDPLSLLSSDLLKEINGIDEKKSDNEKNYSENSQLEDTQKGSEENDNEIENFLDFNNDSNFKIFKKENKNKSFVCSNNNIPLNMNYFLNNNSNFNISNNNNYQNRNTHMNHNNLTNNLNFYNNSFSMNGKQGWICTHCKNFNYESKIFIFIIYNYNNIVRIKCNRCGKGNDNIFNLQNQQINNKHNMREIEEGINDIYYCPLMKAKIQLKGNNESYLRNKKQQQFIERPGDWICYNCQNLNFTFRTNCNRCHMPKIENNKLIYKLENMMNINQNQ